ncbi:hypothetical protein TSUD_286860 [Trifolium subterraneum]|uniref:Uncharacterized protein n=1 Tax=Trifolium subterraneum TaxID=3900 RepID=A0A2Z6LRK7_TRISU|nr:hypothetical protein TSUD_286860 [Trifolium subterraneum]
MAQLLEDQLKKSKSSSTMVPTWPVISNNEEVQKEIGEHIGIINSGMGQMVESDMGQQTIIPPNRPRPPNETDTSPIDNLIPHHVRSEEHGETENFVDANEHETGSMSDSDMEIVRETPCLA